MKMETRTRFLILLSAVFCNLFLTDFCNAGKYTSEYLEHPNGTSTTTITINFKENPPKDTKGLIKDEIRKTPILRLTDEKKEFDGLMKGMKKKTQIYFTNPDCDWSMILPQGSHDYPMEKYYFENTSLETLKKVVIPMFKGYEYNGKGDKTSIRIKLDREMLSKSTDENAQAMNEVLEAQSALIQQGLDQYIEF